jgi:DNA mismatch repair protein MutL
MHAIKKLDEALIAKIAAGEVVENPASVVKELLENSIDAGADSITIEIEKAGKKLIRVTDNGVGIPGNELHLAFERHATSKLFEERDLFEIKSLGFRGEALASIAAVSNMEIITKTRQSTVGKRALMKNGGLIEIGDIGTIDGTTVICKNIFSKIPARLKFLKSDTVESNSIINVVNHLASAQHHISFRLISDKKHLYTTPGNRNLQDTIYSIHGNKIANNLARIDHFHKDMHLHGLVSNLQNSHSNRNLQFIYVNRRWIKSAHISELLNGAFFHILEKRRYPIAFLFLEIHPSSIDINISPNKTEIKFKDEEPLRELFLSAFSELINNHSWIPEETIWTKPDAFARRNPEKKMLGNTTINSHEASNRFLETDIPYSAKPLEKLEGGNENEVQTAFETILEDIAAEQSLPQRNNPHLQTQPSRNMNFFKNLKIIGQIFNSYIICEDTLASEMILIDQHAAHEKVIYETFKSQLDDKSIPSQVLLEPYILNMPETEKTLLIEAKIPLFSIGYLIEDFGSNVLLVRETPSIFNMRTAIAFLEELKNMLLKTNYIDSMKSDEMIYSIAVRACHAAIKANDSLENIEIMTLLANMDNLENPYTCPHGRPTVVRISITEIGKYFNR